MDYEMLIRLILAALWGGIVGAEREYRSKSAGFRTMIMISMGACLFTMLSILIGGGSADRIASNIVTGIGFLGAGVIFRGDNRVNGITTAATIWAVAAVGMGIGSGYYVSAACASVLIIIVLAVLPFVEHLIDQMNQSKTYTIKRNFNENEIKQLNQLYTQFHLKASLYKLIKEGNEITTSWVVQGKQIHHENFIAEMNRTENILRFEY